MKTVDETAVQLAKAAEEAAYLVRQALTNELPATEVDDRRAAYKAASQAYTDHVPQYTQAEIDEMNAAEEARWQRRRALQGLT